MAITTRVATGDDARAVTEAHVRGWQVAYPGLLPREFLDSMEIEPRVGRWRQNLTESALPDGTPAPLNLVAESDGRVVAFACIGVWRDSPADPTLAELWAIYAHPDHWGTGAGRALMTATVDHLRASGIRTAYLWVLEENALARRFYERQGWRADDVTKDDTIAGTVVTERRYSITIDGAGTIEPQ